MWVFHGLSENTVYPKHQLSKGKIKINQLTIKFGVPYFQANPFFFACLELVWTGEGVAANVSVLLLAAINPTEEDDH